ncbi:MAG: hypothetical protein M0D55_17525 [Elusimicrobiota bacterium]|nr:MAG: hypothetical protein M0D55_17525 [Elusimicrobiota bacterium]
MSQQPVSSIGELQPSGGLERETPVMRTNNGLFAQTLPLITNGPEAELETEAFAFGNGCGSAPEGQSRSAIVPTRRASEP